MFDPEPFAPLRWLFLDMDGFFAACEQQDRPELRGRPVAVVPVLAASTCCIAASQEAKRLGIKTGTPLREARERCPDLAVVHARPPFYVKVHHAILAAVETCLPVTRVYSIDELWARLGANQREPTDARRLAEAVKRAIRGRVGACVTCSVGVASTRLLAKAASDLDKPDGLRILGPEDLPAAFAPWPLQAWPGIGAGIYRRLLRHGVVDTPTLWALPRTRMRDIWGSVVGEHFWYGLHGHDTPEPTTGHHSLGHAHVLPPDLRHDAGAHAVLIRLLHRAATRLRRMDYWAGGLHAGVAYYTVRRDREQYWQDHLTFPACQDTQTFIEKLQELWDRRPGVVVHAGTPFRVEVTLGELVCAASATGSLFPQQIRRRSLAAAMDAVDQKYGRETLYFGGMLTCTHDMPDKIAFGRVPE